MWVDTQIPSLDWSILPTKRTLLPHAEPYTHLPPLQTLDCSVCSAHLPRSRSGALLQFAEEHSALGLTVPFFVSARQLTASLLFHCIFPFTGIQLKRTRCLGIQVCQNPFKCLWGFPPSPQCLSASPHLPPFICPPSLHSLSVRSHGDEAH